MHGHRPVVQSGRRQSVSPREIIEANLARVSQRTTDAGVETALIRGTAL
jgi:hypothetical protein